MKLRGKITFFNKEKSFGFIQVIDQDLEELFVRTCDTKDNKPLEIGAIVEFETWKPKTLDMVAVKNVEIV